MVLALVPAAFFHTWMNELDEQLTSRELIKKSETIERSGRVVALTGKEEMMNGFTRTIVMKVRATHQAVFKEPLPRKCTTNLTPQILLKDERPCMSIETESIPTSVALFYCPYYAIPSSVSRRPLDLAPSGNGACRLTSYFSLPLFYSLHRCVSRFGRSTYSSALNHTRRWQIVARLHPDGADGNR